MKRSYRAVLILLALVSTISCAQQINPEDDNFRPWRIGVAIPWTYVSGVSQAYGISEAENWTSMMLPYGQLVLSESRRDINKIRHSLNDKSYEGYGIPLGPSNFIPNQVGTGKKTLPDELYIYWNSDFTHTSYATVVKVTPQIKSAMVKAYPHPSWRFKGQNCYQTDFVFGLLPNGKTKLWLKGCQIYTYVGEFEPTKAVPSSGSWSKDTSSSYYSAKKERLKIEPIPWDKVNQVWYDKEKYTMQNIDDVVKL